MVLPKMKLLGLNNPIGIGVLTYLRLEVPVHDFELMQVF